MSDAITADISRNELIKIAVGGLISGVLTPLLPDVIDLFPRAPAMLGIALVAVPFAALVFIVVRRRSANPLWASVLAAIITMIAFVAAVNAAVYIDGQMAGSPRLGA